MRRVTFVGSALAVPFGLASGAPALGMETLVAPERAHAIVDDIARTVVEVGADPFRTSSRAAFDAVRARIDARLVAPLERRSLWLAVAPLLASLNDGHVQFTPDFFGTAFERNERVVFPLGTEIGADGHLYVVSNGGTADIRLGSRVVAVNGLPGEEIAAGALAVQGGQNARLRRAFASPRAYLYACFGALRRFDVTLEDAGGTRRTLAMSTIDRVEYLARQASTKQAPYTYATLARGRVGCITFSACRDLDGMRRFANATFARIAAKRPVAVIVDVRMNGGGDSRVGNLLWSYLTNRPFTQFGGGEVRVSERLKREYGRNKYISLYGADAWEASDGTLLRRSGGEPLPPENVANRYTGPVYLLIGPRTFSSGMGFATAARDFGLATIVGEETAEPVISTGELYAAPYRDVEMTAYVTTKLFFGPKPRPEGQGVVPDVPVVTTLADRISGRDPVRAKALALIGATSPECR